MRNFKQKFFEKKLQQELAIKNGILTVDESSCDGCGKCIETCPQTAIGMKTLSVGESKNLSFKGRLKVWVKGNQKAEINPDLCTSCGLCMRGCHELAIHKIKRQEPSASAERLQKMAV